MTASRKKLVSVLLIGACALLAVAGTSTAVAQNPKAKAKVSLESRNFALPAQAGGQSGVATASAPCPGNRTLVGGGSRFDPSIALPTDVELVSSGPVSNAWETVYDNNVETAGQSVFSEALCLKNRLKVKGGDGGRVRPRVKQVTVPLVLPADVTNLGIATVDVPCPTGYTVTSGGARFIGGAPGTTDANEVTVWESGPEGNGWHVTYDNDSDDAPGNAEASALCLKNKSKVKAGEDGKARAKVVQETQTVTLPPQGDPNNGVAQFDVPCPEGTKLVGGGARFLPGAQVPDLPGPGNENGGIELSESGPSGNAWHVRYNNNLANAQSVLISASCLRKNLKVK